MMLKSMKPATQQREKVEKEDFECSIIASRNAHMVDKVPATRLLEVRDRRRWQVHESILDVIGQTPVVKLRRMAPPGVNVFVKCENINPGGSLKDRLAVGIIEWAEANERLKPGQTVVEASSGNTGE